MVFVPHRGDLPARIGPGVPLIPDIGPAELDASVYTDPARFELERRKVLNKSWQIVCRSSEIAGVGDHLVWEGQGETIVVTRRRDGGVAGFHNVCQHRGARIVKESGCGARRFNCHWHNWTYDFEGNVLGVPDREDFAPDARERPQRRKASGRTATIAASVDLRRYRGSAIPRPPRASRPDECFQRSDASVAGDCNGDDRVAWRMRGGRRVLT